MSLENLLKIGQLKAHPPDADEIERLLSAAERNLRDARVKNISAETRFDAAYKAVMQSALAALMMHGYRPDTSRPGHHMTVVQSVPLTMESIACSPKTNSNNNAYSGSKTTAGTLSSVQTFATSIASCSQDYL